MHLDEDLVGSGLGDRQGDEFGRVAELEDLNSLH